ncbi:MAG TPA: BadF/BadG/BcrA/BcrD ATPase family protein [Candidatus Limnocylindrales bacterium]|nr:BadF/BadG/BcrA/BcrD ATPase family protein [Candidatus Limnocylindrales bacterium]
MTVAVLAVDGGNSKTDVTLVERDGTVLSCVRGPTISHQVIGANAGAVRLRELVDKAHRAAGREPHPAEMGVYCLAGADFHSDTRLLRRAFDKHALATTYEVLNDCFAALRAGAPKGWGVVLICGQGINAAAVGPDGRSARFAGIGDLSGDWGGGGGLGAGALAAAIRARDGRAPRTALETAVASHFGKRTPEQVMLAMYEGRLDSARRRELAPAVFAAAEDGDEVARALLDRLADELAGMAVALARRLRMTRLETDIVLAGGVFTATEPDFYARLYERTRAQIPDARFVRPTLPPVAGSALIGLDRILIDDADRHAAATRLALTFAQTEH